ncbi:hypothetical protein Q9233_006053 [Columba guinea]|nr:hypothetical protein Q9233_006053 [Columba guinea]
MDNRQWLLTAGQRGDLQPLSFQPGVLYGYRYSLDVRLEHTSLPALRGARLQAEASVQLRRLWRDTGGEELLQVQIHDLKAQRQPKEERSEDGPGGPLAGIALSREEQAELQQPVFISWSSGKVKAFHGDGAESILISNLKRGVISLLQLQPHAGTTVEVGGRLWELPSHIRRVQPFHHEDKRSPQLHKPTLRVHLRKQSKSISLVVVGSTYTKYIRAVPQHFPSRLQPPAPAWLGALALRPIPTVGCTNIAQQEQGSFEMFGVRWQPSSSSQYVVKDSLLQAVLAEESHVLSPALRSTTSIKISSRQQLQLVSPPMPGPAEVTGQSLKDVLAGTKERHQPLGMASLPFRRVCTHCPSLRAYLKAFDSQRVKIDPSKAATTWQFQRFIQMLRSAEKRDVLQLLRRAPEEML